MLRMILVIVLVVLRGSACFAENLALKRPYTFSHPPNYGGCTDAGDATDLPTSQPIGASSQANFL